MDTDQLKCFLKFLKVFFEMWNVFRQLNESNEIDFKLDIKEFHKATTHDWFKKNNFDINDDNYQPIPISKNQDLTSQHKNPKSCLINYPMNIDKLMYWI